MAAPEAPASVRKQCPNATILMGSEASGTIWSARGNARKFAALWTGPLEGLKVAISDRARLPKSKSGMT